MSNDSSRFKPRLSRRDAIKLIGAGTTAGSEVGALVVSRNDWAWYHDGLSVNLTADANYE